MRFPKRVPLASLFAIVVIAAGCFGTREVADREHLIGRWQGEVTEGDLQYDLLMTIDNLVPGEHAGAAVYSGSLSCVGALTLESRDRGRLVLRESIDDSALCADGGRIEITVRLDGDLDWRWFDRGSSEIAAHAILHRR